MGTLIAVITLLVWVAIGVFNYWIWAKSKANGNLWMMVGSGLVALMMLLGLIRAYLGELHPWLMLAGNVLFGFGFYLSVKPQIAAQMAALKEKASNLTKASDGDDGGEKADS